VANLRAGEREILLGGRPRSSRIAAWAPRFTTRLRTFVTKWVRQERERSVRKRRPSRQVSGDVPHVLAGREPIVTMFG